MYSKCIDKFIFLVTIAIVFDLTHFIPEKQNVSKF